MLGWRPLAFREGASQLDAAGVGQSEESKQVSELQLEQTLVIIKPDGVQRGLVGEIVGRLERRGLKIVAMELRMIDRALAERHYGEHAGKPFFNGLVDYIVSGPVVTLVLEGPQAIAATRATIGATKPVEAAPGTIRGDLGMMIGRNLIHGSDKAESAAKEVALFFGDRVLGGWSRGADDWIWE
jgi:nucleoside-diphosphate kinase